MDWNCIYAEGYDEGTSTKNLWKFVLLDATKTGLKLTISYNGYYGLGATYYVNCNGKWEAPYMYLIPEDKSKPFSIETHPPGAQTAFSNASTF